MSLDYAQLVIDNEFIRMVRSIAKGIPVNDYTLATEVINHVGPRGHFLMEEQTLAEMHEQSDSALFSRGARDAWVDAGSKTINDLAREKAKEILAKHKPLPLPAGAEEKMNDILKEADKIYCKKK